MKRIKRKSVNEVDVNRNVAVKRPRRKTIDRGEDVSSAVTTPLVRKVFEQVFKQLPSSLDFNSKKDNSVVSNNCGFCKILSGKLCAQCQTILDKNEERRKKVEIIDVGDGDGIESDDEDSGNDEESQTEDEEEFSFIPVDRKLTKVKSPTLKHQEWKWFGRGVKEGTREYFKKVSLNGQTVYLGDKVLVDKAQCKIPAVAIIKKLYREKGGSKFAHIQFFQRCSESFIGGGPGSKAELLLLNLCNDAWPLSAVLGTCKVRMEEPPDVVEWRAGAEHRAAGGDAEGGAGSSTDLQFWCRFRLDPRDRSKRLEHLKFRSRGRVWRDITVCDECESSKLRTEVNTSVMWDKRPLNVGDSIFYVDNKHRRATKGNKKIIFENEPCDEVLYPEYHRKPKFFTRREAVPPFRLGYIQRIYKRCREFQDDKCGGCGSDCPEVWLTVTEFIRPEEIGELEEFQNEVFLTEKTSHLPLDRVTGRVWMKFVDSEKESAEWLDLEDWTAGGEHRWFFRKLFSQKSNYLQDPPEWARKIGCNVDVEHFSYPVLNNKLSCMDVFCGAGGFSQGLSEAGVAVSKWAVEMSEPAARAFQLNHPECSVAQEDSREVLRALLAGSRTSPAGVSLPSRGEVDILVGGPPCQGFTGVNRFSSGLYSQALNSLVATYLSYCDVLRPAFFLLENVTGFATFAGGRVLKCVLSALHTMGYQSCVGVLQAGEYGAGQQRRRVVVMAAGPGRPLPRLPDPTHTFPWAGSLAVNLGQTRISASGRRRQLAGSAPHRAVTVRDLLSDLPAEEGGSAYTCPPRSTFQRRARAGSPGLTEHSSLPLGPADLARVALVPRRPGADWRDLPNTELQLPDGSWLSKLCYGPDGAVCVCKDGVSKCQPQPATTIPWKLSHTADRQKNWAGCYGRLDHSGCFGTTLTIPQPSFKQGRVVHPTADRLVTVREAARSQTFPDSYRFYGTLEQKYKQVGNAVPCMLAKAVGLEIRKVLCETE